MTRLDKEGELEAVGTRARRESAKPVVSFVDASPVQDARLRRDGRAVSLQRSSGVLGLRPVRIAKRDVEDAPVVVAAGRCHFSIPCLDHGACYSRASSTVRGAR